MDFQKMLTEGTKDIETRGRSSDWASRSLTYLMIGDFESAFRDCKRANELAWNEYPVKIRSPEPLAWLDCLATIEFLRGNYDETRALLMKAVAHIRKGTATSADMAGGASEGLLLWFLGAYMKNDLDRNVARDYLAWLAKKPKINTWPGPLALFLLGKMSLADALKQEFGTGNTAELERQARRKPLIERGLQKAYFYAGVDLLERGDEAGAKSMFQKCVDVGEPTVENEYYIARHLVKPLTKK